MIAHAENLSYLYELIKEECNRFKGTSRSVSQTYRIIKHFYKLREVGINLIY